MTGQGPTMRRMGITHVVAIVLTWTTAGAQPPAERRRCCRRWTRSGGARRVDRRARARSRPGRRGRRAADRGAGAPRRAGRRPSRARRERLGAIVFDHDNVPATTLTIDVAAVAAIVARVRLGGRPFDQWPPAWRDTLVGRALGRVMAHEIGHYLLASRVHTSEGLMRAAFDGDELLCARARRLRGAGARPAAAPDEAGRPGPRVSLAENAR